MTNWKVGDWVIFDLSVGQIKEIRDHNNALFSDGWFETSGRLMDRFRPLTLRSKRIVEWFETMVDRLRQINGAAGFNWPDIRRHFSQLALDAIDDDSEGNKKFFDQANDFIQQAKEYKPTIYGVKLFRPKVGNA